MGKIKLSTNLQKKLDSEIDSIIKIISSKYNIEINKLRLLNDNLDNICKANIWNNGYPKRCSRQRCNGGEYCNTHEKQRNKFGAIKMGDYKKTHNSKIDMDKYLELECDLIEYAGCNYYINNHDVFKIIDSDKEIVEPVNKILKNTILQAI